jgi:hypothetical protein
MSDPLMSDSPSVRVRTADHQQPRHTLVSLLEIAPNPDVVRCLEAAILALPLATQPAPVDAASRQNGPASLQAVHDGLRLMITSQAETRRHLVICDMWVCSAARYWNGARLRPLSAI